MSGIAGETANPRATANPRSMWAAYAAAAWAFLFAAMSFYWALGGRLGLETLGDFVVSMADDPAFVAFVWLTGFLKVALGLVALALIAGGPLAKPPWQRLVRVAAWVIGIALTLYGVSLLLQHALMLVGVAPVSASLGAAALPWHVWLWDPFWLLGGVLFVAAAWQQSRTARA